MKKVKIVCMALAIFIGIGGALASNIRTRQNCASDTQYYLVGTNYVQAGTVGVDYVCVQVPLNCTYYKPNPISQPTVYNPCVVGEYTPIP